MKERDVEEVKRVLIVSVLFVFVLIIGVLIVVVWHGNGGKETKISSIAVAVNEAVLNKNVSECNNLGNLADIKYCMIKANGDRAYCTQLDDLNKSINIYIQGGRYNASISEKEFCYFTIARLNNSYCDKTQAKDACLAYNSK